MKSVKQIKKQLASVEARILELAAPAPAKKLGRLGYRSDILTAATLLQLVEDGHTLVIKGGSLHVKGNGNSAKVNLHQLKPPVNPDADPALVSFVATTFYDDPSEFSTRMKQKQALLESQPLSKVIKKYARAEAVITALVNAGLLVIMETRAKVEARIQEMAAKYSSGVKGNKEVQKIIYELDGQGTKYDELEDSGELSVPKRIKEQEKAQDALIKKLHSKGLDATFDNYLARWVAHPKGTVYRAKQEKVKLMPCYD